jgi:hypothetical protein
MCKIEIFSHKGIQRFLGPPKTMNLILLPKAKMGIAYLLLLSVAKFAIHNSTGS